MTDEYLRLREALNVGDVKRRDRLVRRIKKMRAEAALDRDTLLHWNRTHPEETPFDVSFEESVIAWCDGRGPFPVLPESP